MYVFGAHGRWMVDIYIYIWEISRQIYKRPVIFGNKQLLGPIGLIGIIWNTRWWFQILFIITLFREDSQFDEHIFQMGCFNHQPVVLFLIIIISNHKLYSQGRTLIIITLPETNSSHLKMDGWNISFLLG